MATDTKALARVESFEVLDVAPRDVADMLLAASGGQQLSPFDLDVVKVPSGQGAAMWSVPSLEGEEAVKTVEGIIALQRTVRSYWTKSIDDGGNAPPDCSSQDGQTGIGAPSAHPAFEEHAEIRYGTDGSEIRRGRFECMDCPYAQFGSDTKSGRGQACKQNLLLFLLRPDSLIPMVVKVPPSSVKPMRSFILRLAGQRVPPFGAVISLGLKKTQNAGGTAYFEIEPSFVRKLNDDELTKMRALRDSLLPVLSGVRIEAE